MALDPELLASVVDDLVAPAPPPSETSVDRVASTLARARREADEPAA